jgi:glycosyltransferase involved in cell wall biosynthesis
VLTISEFTKGEILRYCAECGIAVPPLTVVRLGDVIDAADSSEPPPLPRFVPSRPFFVCVSTLDVRKNHRLLYDAWSQLAAADPDTCPDLLCIGTKHVLVDDLLHEIRHDRAVNGRIHLLDDVTDHELAWYYSACTATIYPSRYEGWGLPVAESLGRGKLCLASNATSIPEIDADLPAFFDPLDAHGLACLVRKAVDEPDWVSEREREIRDSFVATPWSHTAGQVLAAVRPATAAIRRAA